MHLSITTIDGDCYRSAEILRRVRLRAAEKRSSEWQGTGEWISNGPRQKAGPT
jgi:hypothetical protein